MSNIVIIGNGFDRQLGLKTDYISFLDWVEDKNEYFENTILKGMEIFKEWIVKTKHEVNEKWIEYFLDILQNHSDIIKANDNFFGPINEGANYFFRLVEEYYQTNSQTEDLYIKSKIDAIRYLLPVTNRKIFIVEFPKSNLWFSYFNYLRKIDNESDFNILFKESAGGKGEWIDLETLIENNIKLKLKEKEFLDGNINIFSFLKTMLGNVLSSSEIDNKLWVDFIELKKLLSNYIKEQEELFINKLDLYINEDELTWLFHYENQYVNFNYSKCFSLFSKMNKVQYPIDSIMHYHVHGTIEDRENIVFGMDSYLRNEEIDIQRAGKSTLENKLLSNKDTSKYSKIHQLFSLQKDKKRVSFKIPDKLVIIGHSIGEQDYSYFFSLMDRNIEHIVIEYYWYNYNVGSGNNKQQGETALFNMINAYEKYANKRVFHRMIFERRIQFTEVHIPKIID